VSVSDRKDPLVESNEVARGFDLVFNSAPEVGHSGELAHEVIDQALTFLPALAYDVADLLGSGSVEPCITVFR